jgi:lysophospholipase L1-like esterase
MLAALSACTRAEHHSLPPPASAPVNVSANLSANANEPASAYPSPPASASQPVPVPVPALPLKPHRYIIAAIGDSLTDPRSHGGGYLEYLKTRCPTLEIDNFGKGGTMVNQMRRRFDDQVAGSVQRYTHLVIFGGVNDLYSDLTAFRTPAKIEADLDYMYAWGKAHDVKVVALTVAPWGGFKRYFNATRAEATRSVNAWIREQPGRGHVDQVVDAYALLSCGDPESLCERFVQPFKDGIHFGRAGHELLGQALYQQAFSDCE